MKDRYNQACRVLSNINEHLPTLCSFAAFCESVVELGSGVSARSTIAFCCASGVERVRSFDIKPPDKPLVAALRKDAKDVGVELEFLQADTSLASVVGEDGCDFLFVDSLHTGRQVDLELQLNAHSVRRFIGFHDVVTYGYRDQYSEGPGILPSIFEFMRQHPEWDVRHFSHRNNGLLIIGKPEYA